MYSSADITLRVLTDCASQLAKLQAELSAGFSHGESQDQYYKMLDLCGQIKKSTDIVERRIKG